MRLPSCLLVILACLLGTAPGVAQTRPEMEHALRGHGMPTDAPGLAAFLDQGWRSGTPPATLPEEPYQKTNLVVYAWNLLALRYTETQTQPALRERLAELALRYASGDFPPAVRQIVDEDLAGIDAQAVSQARLTRLERLRYNGMVALGLFGMQSAQTREAARAVYDDEPRPIVRVAYAQALALLGDLSVLDDLVAEVAKANRESSVAAARSLHVLLGQNIALGSNLAVEPRKEAAAEIVKWWQANRSAVLVVDRADAVDRQMHRPPVRHPVFRTLQDLLRASADRLDVTDQRGSRTAADRLDKMGPALGKNLEPILADPREDLDVRVEAIRWYVRLYGDKANRRLKKLLKDPNPEIVQLVRGVLDRKPPEAPIPVLPPQ